MHVFSLLPLLTFRCTNDRFRHCMRNMPLRLPETLFSVSWSVTGYRSPSRSSSPFVNFCMKWRFDNEFVVDRIILLIVKTPYHTKFHDRQIWKKFCSILIWFILHIPPSKIRLFITSLLTGHNLSESMRRSISSYSYYCLLVVVELVSIQEKSHTELFSARTRLNLSGFIYGLGEDVLGRWICVCVCVIGGENKRNSNKLRTKT